MLCDLEFFVRTIDEKETEIEDSKRLAFRSKYISEIDALKKSLNEYYVNCVIQEQIQNDIQAILEAKESKLYFKKWENAWKFYSDRYGWSEIESERSKYSYFVIKASDAGIKFAYSYAAMEYAKMKDSVEFEKMLTNMLDSDDGCWFSVIEGINYWILLNGDTTEGIRQILNRVKQTAEIVQLENGYYKPKQ